MNQRAPYDPRSVANILISLSISRSDDLTQMALYKIMYYAHGWYLAAYNRPLIKDGFQAWRYGPVVRAVRDALRDHRDRPIKAMISAFDFQTGRTHQPGNEVEDVDRGFVENIYTSYIQFHAYRLSDMTHEAGSPWDKVWNNSASFANVGMRISDESVRLHFLRLLEAQSKS